MNVETNTPKPAEPTPKPADTSALEKKIAALERENQRLQKTSALKESFLKSGGNAKNYSHFEKLQDLDKLDLNNIDKFVEDSKKDYDWAFGKPNTQTPTATGKNPINTDTPSNTTYTNKDFVIG